MNREELRSTAQALATRGKGILAVDESTGTVGKRLAGINVAVSYTHLRAHETG